MAIKKSKGRSKRLNKATRLQATKPLAGSLYQSCCSGQHFSK